MDSLMRLPSVVGNATIADLVASQESHIDKRHAQTVKTEEKHIARQGQPAPHWQLQFEKFSHIVCLDGAFGRFWRAGVGVLKRRCLPFPPLHLIIYST